MVKSPHSNDEMRYALIHHFALIQTEGHRNQTTDAMYYESITHIMVPLSYFL